MRVEWTVLDGAMAESILATSIYIDRPRSNRIRPSKGDYGIDVLEPVAGGDDLFDVWQIKRFATNLKSSEKTQIDESFRRVLTALVRRGVTLRHWHLVLPLDPTIENRLDWFSKMPARVFAAMKADTKLALSADETIKIQGWLDDPATEIRWEGLDFCESAVAAHPEVVDYFLHGGSQRLRDAVETLASLLTRQQDLETDVDSPATLQPSEIADHLRTVQSALDGDPHFRYGFQVEPQPNEVHYEPGLIAATQRRWPGGLTLTYRIYTRFDEALNERPVPVTFEFLFDDPEFDRRAYENWRDYGTEFAGPAAVAVGLPGGLATDGEGHVHFPSHPSAPFQRRYRLATADGRKITDLMFNCISTVGLSREAARTTGTDTTGIVSVEFRGNLRENSAAVSFSAKPLDGLEVLRAAPVAKFLSSWTAGNRLQVAEAFGGRFADLHPIPTNEELIHPLIATWIYDLAEIQEQVDQTIFLPPMSQVTYNDVRRIHDAAALLRGQTVVARWRDLELSDLTEELSNGHVQLETDDALEITVGEQRLHLGTQRLTFLSAEITSDGETVRARPKLNDTVHRTFVDSRTTGAATAVRGRPVREEN